MKNEFLLNRMQLVTTYFQLLTDKGYRMLDLNMIEPFVSEDKQYHPSNIVFERNESMKSIRSDWTRSILNYRRLYQLSDNYLGYFGPVIRENQTIYQAGVELYTAETDDIIQSMLMHFEFIEAQSEMPIQTMIINDEKLIDLYTEKYQLDENIKYLIYEKDISSLKDRLGAEHPLYQLMVLPVSQQYAQVVTEFEGRPLIKAIQQLHESVAAFNFKFILDLSFRSPQRYYNGFYFQIFLDQNIPVLSGGQYENNAFGIAINLSDGGLI